MRTVHEQQGSTSTRPDPARPVSLSFRQIQCLYWVQEGKSSRDIGVILGVSHRIVERHVFRACQKLGVRTRLQAVIRARSLGFIGDQPRANKRLA